MNELEGSRRLQDQGEPRPPDFLFVGGNSPAASVGQKRKINAKLRGAGMPFSFYNEAMNSRKEFVKSFRKSPAKKCQEVI